MFEILNRYSKGQLEGVTPPPSLKHKVVFYTQVFIEATIYRIVGENKYLRWPWLSRWFENWH